MTTWIVSCTLWFVSCWFESKYFETCWIDSFVSSGLMIFLDESYHCSLICNNVYMGFTGLIHTFACVVLNRIDIRLENLWFNSNVLWIIPIFITSIFPIFTCQNQFILSMIRIMSIFLPLKLHLSLMSRAVNKTLKYKAPIIEPPSKSQFFGFLLNKFTLGPSPIVIPQFLT